MDITFQTLGIATYSFRKIDGTGHSNPIPVAKVKKEVKSKMWKAVAVTTAAVGLTVAEDIITGGAGVLDDLPTAIITLKRVSAIFGL
jgi:microsomal dipeptidase-like Zn-dependent dipeptidase